MTSSRQFIRPKAINILDFFCVQTFFLFGKFWECGEILITGWSFNIVQVLFVIVSKH